MSKNDDIGLAFVGVACGLLYFYHGFCSLRTKRLIKNMPTSTIRGMAMGLVEICGRAKSNIVRTAPFHKRNASFIITPLSAWKGLAATVVGSKLKKMMGKTNTLN